MNRTLALTSACAALAACAPSPDGPAGAQFVCGDEPLGTARARIVVDLRLHSGKANRAPGATDVRAVEAAGGRVLHRFPVAILRAELDTGAVRALVAGPRAIAEYAHVVEDTADRRVPVAVSYAMQVTPADRRVLDVLGVTPRRRFPGLPPVVDAWWPESVVTRVARLPSVVSVRARSVGCGRAASAGAGA
jgi:hypothetical protein